MYREYRENHEDEEIKSDYKNEDTKIRTLLRKRMGTKMLFGTISSSEVVMRVKDRTRAHVYRLRSYGRRKYPHDEEEEVTGDHVVGV